MKPHVARNSGNNEWYTPPEYIKAVTSVMGGIDCDPASTVIGNKTVKATVFWTKEQDGLRRKWGRRAFLNPPYAQPLIDDFSKAVIKRLKSGEVEEICILVNNATETQWCQRLLRVSAGVCFIKGRVRFLDPEGRPGAPLQGQAVFYIGPYMDRFKRYFRKFGPVRGKV